MRAIDALDRCNVYMHIIMICIQVYCFDICALCLCIEHSIHVYKLYMYRLLCAFEIVYAGSILQRHVIICIYNDTNDDNDNNDDN